VGEAMWIVPAVAGGAVLGAFFFGSLWLTVQRLPRVERPGLVVLVSFFARTLVTLLGFYLLMDGRWERLVAALLGFLAARAVILPLARPRADGRTKEQAHDLKPG
jgi:F1F0 ATPase subunit 2